MSKSREAVGPDPSFVQWRSGHRVGKINGIGSSFSRAIATGKLLSPDSSALIIMSLIDLAWHDFRFDGISEIRERVDESDIDPSLRLKILQHIDEISR